MKNKKWLWITLSVILALVVLAGAVGVGFRLGMTQNPAFLKQLADLRAQRVQQFQKQNPNPQGQGNVPQPNLPGQNPPGWEMNPHGQGFGRGFDPRFQDNRGFDRGDRFDRRGGFFSPLSGLFRLIILGVLIWLVYKFATNSGWKIVRVTQPAPAVAPAAVVSNEPAPAEQKDEA